MKLDCTGMACPRPVIETKKELDKSDVTEVTTLVDNHVAVENLKKLAESMGAYATEKEEGENWSVTIVKTGNTKTEEACSCIADGGKFVIAFSKDYMGEGERALGDILIKSFVYTVTADDKKPDEIYMFNSGVKLACEGSPVLEDLKALAANGVKINSCGTCLDFYNLKEKVMVGGISNMYAIYEGLRSADRLVEI